MAEINDFDTTDASNTDRWAEGMRLNAVNNGGRADEGILARWHKDTNASIAAGGTVDAITVAANQTLAAYYDGLIIAFESSGANTGAVTLNVDGVDADAVVKNGSTALVAGDIANGAKVICISDGTVWHMITPSGNDANADLATHIADTTTHGSATALVGVDETQTLTAKTLTAPTINGVVGGTATSQTITTLTTTNVDGVLGDNTPAVVNATTGAYSGEITATTTPTNVGHLTNKQYVDDLFLGMAKRGTVRAATTGNITIATALNNGDTLDTSVTLATNDLVLVKDQTASEENGIYVVGASPARDDLYDAYDEHPGALIAIQEGDVNADLMYLCTSNEGGVLDTNAIVWNKVTPQNVGTVTSIATGTGLTGGPITGSGTVSATGTLADVAGLAVTNGGFIVGDGGNFVLETGSTVMTSIGGIVVDTTPQLGGELDGQDNIVSKINLKDYGEITNAIGGTGGGTQDIDLTLGNSVSATVDTSANTFTFSNPTASDELCGFTLTLTNGGSQTVNWPASVDWAAATAPDLTAAGVDVLVFFTVDGGTTWHGMIASTDSS